MLRNSLGIKSAIIILLLLTTSVSKAGNLIDSLWTNLDATIQNSANIDNQKRIKIQALSQMAVHLNSTPDLAYAYSIFTQLFEEYQSYKYDSSFFYIRKLMDIAYKTANPELIADAKLKMSFVLLSSGFFNEAADTLLTIDLTTLSNRLKVEYFTTFHRIWIDMADFSEDPYYGPIYNSKANSALMEALAICDSNSENYLFLNGLYALRNYDLLKAKYFYEKLDAEGENTLHQQAIIASSLSYIYEQLKMPEKAMQQLFHAAKLDIQASTKETVALTNLAKILYQKGYNEYALVCITQALNDANFYGARHRKAQITNILPIVEGTMLKTKERQSRVFRLYSTALTLLVIILIAFAFVTIKQNLNLKKTRKTLKLTINELTNTNQNLLEANKIKEEYIGHFFNIISNYIDKIENLKKAITRQLVAKKVTGIDDLFYNIELQKEREMLLASFDATFMRLFPGFVETYNTLVSSDDMVPMNTEVVFSPELRIYALKRLGINDNETIARFLGYTVSTIYTYKTKLKKRALNPNINLDEVLMRIELKK